jgi:hypothetical protein
LRLGGAILVFAILSGLGGCERPGERAEPDDSSVEASEPESAGEEEDTAPAKCVRSKPPTSGEEKRLRDAVREFAEARAREGYMSADDAERIVVVAFSEDWPARRVGPVAHLETPLAYERRAAEEQTWDTPTDCDRLDAAFADLERRGIVARQNFMDCAECGFDEIRAVVQQRVAAGHNVRGYAFFVETDAEQAARGEGLGLSYGALDDSEKKWAAIGREVAAALNRQGLTATWSGDTNERIAIENIVWKKRRTTVAPAAKQVRAQRN